MFRWHLVGARTLPYDGWSVVCVFVCGLSVYLFVVFGGENSGGCQWSNYSIGSVISLCCLEFWFGGSKVHWAFHEKSGFSVQPRCAMCLCGCLF